MNIEMRNEMKKEQHIKVLSIEEQIKRFMRIRERVNNGVQNFHGWTVTIPGELIMDFQTLILCCKVIIEKEYGKWDTQIKNFEEEEEKK